MLDGNAFVTLKVSRFGMDDYVTKPIRVDALVEALLNASPQAGVPT